MEKNYRYFKDQNSGKICRIHLEQDETPWNPREDMDGNIGHMMVWWNRYSLGDTKENTYADPEAFVNDMVRNHVSDNVIINFVKAKKTSNGLELVYDRKEKLWELWGYWKVYWNGNKVHHGVIESNNELDFLIDDIVEAMSFEDKWKLLERNGIAYLPLYIYEHSGITISTGGFSCPWDSGQAGWIYTTKEEIMKCGGSIRNEKGNYIKVTEKNWRKAAQVWMEGEVKLYDQYIQGDCYGYIIDELDMDYQAALESKMNLLDEDDMEWNENVDSCWGFFSEKWGDDLIEEIAKEVANFEKLCDDLKEVA